jgi:hypothetical protein
MANPLIATARAGSSSPAPAEWAVGGEASEGRRSSTDVLDARRMPDAVAGTDNAAGRGRCSSSAYLQSARSDQGNNTRHFVFGTLAALKFKFAASGRILVTQSLFTFLHSEKNSHVSIHCASTQNTERALFVLLNLDMLNSSILFCTFAFQLLDRIGD